jgi:hypothetical protein
VCVESIKTPSSDQFLDHFRLWWVASGWRNHRRHDLTPALVWKSGTRLCTGWCGWRGQRRWRWSLRRTRVVHKRTLVLDGMRCWRGGRNKKYMLERNRFSRQVEYHIVCQWLFRRGIPEIHVDHGKTTVRILPPPPRIAMHRNNRHMST